MTDWREPVPGEPPEAAAMREGMRRNFEREEWEKQERDARHRPTSEVPQADERSPWSDASDDELTWLRKAVLLARDLETCRALLQGQRVPQSRLDPEWLRRFGMTERSAA